MKTINEIIQAPDPVAAVAALPDADIARLRYGIENFNPGAAGLNAAECETWWAIEPLLINRLKSLVAPTQLWEPCERCGAEPSYITPAGHLCITCQTTESH